MKKTTIAIKLEHVSKEYYIHHEKPTLVEKFVRGKEEKFTALKNINLEIKKGEKIGIIGPNGSGKTTLLKILAGITTPTKGRITTEGSIVSLIDLDAGFHPDLTGYQNIFINGMLIGMNKHDIENNIQNIIRYADIKQFIDAPLYTYSSGMALRLGFAIAIHANPKILLLDEGLAVGDLSFQKKVDASLKEILKKKITVIIVSHSIEFMRAYQARILLMKDGEIVMDGKSNVISSYSKSIKNVTPPTSYV